MGVAKGEQYVVGIEDGYGEGCGQTRKGQRARGQQSTHHHHSGTRVRLAVCGHRVDCGTRVIAGHAGHDPSTHTHTHTHSMQSCSRLPRRFLSRHRACCVNAGSVPTHTRAMAKGPQGQADPKAKPSPRPSRPQGQAAPKAKPSPRPSRPQGQAGPHDQVAPKAKSHDGSLHNEFVHKAGERRADKV